MSKACGITWLKGLPMLAALMATPALAEPSPCDAVVRTIRHQAIRPATANRPIDLERLLPARLGTPAPATQDPMVLARAKAQFSPGDFDTLTVQAVAPDIWRAESMQGTLHCTEDRFFRLDAGGVVRAIPTPPSFGELCDTGWRQMRTGPDGPALIEIESFANPDLGFDLEITPWNGGWGQACRASLRFTDRFTLTERFCGDKAICAAGARAAPKLAEAAARPVPGHAEVPMTYPDARGALATFGGEAKTEFTDYSDAQGSLAVTLAGRHLVAHVGVGGVGWRAIGDYLVTLYPPGDGDHPLAGYVVERRVIGLKSATVSVPEPWVNPH